MLPNVDPDFRSPVSPDTVVDPDLATGAKRTFPEFYYPISPMEFISFMLMGGYLDSESMKGINLFDDEPAKEPS